MGRYFGREPRYSRQELERQAQEAIDVRIALGRPPEEEFLPLRRRLAEIDRAAITPAVDLLPDSQPLRIHTVRPPAPAAHAAPVGRSAPAPEKRAAERQPVAARTSAN